MVGGGEDKLNFQFRCLDCGEKFDIISPIGSIPTRPVCQCGGKVVRVFAPLGVKYRCSGFYSTDKVLSEPEEDV
jgi:predicted nucleic acid-binding Zn ribbon protein